MSIALSFSFFLVLMMAVGLMSTRRRNQTADSYLNAGRSHGRFVIALSGAASATSGFIMIGAVGAGYTMGLMAVLMPISWFLGDFAFWTLFPDKINRIGRDSDSNTVPELISFTATGSRLSPLRRLLASIIIVFVGLYAVGQFLAAGKAVNGVFELPIPVAVCLSALVILVYSARGGLQSSIPTQFVQAVIMLFTTVGMFAVAIYVGGGPSEILSQLQSADPGLLYIDGGRGLLLVAVFIFGFATTAFTFDLGQPHLLVRILATKSPAEAARARWIYLGFMQATWISMSLFGLMMVVLLPDMGDPEQALPVFAKNNLHPILAGACLAGIFAAVASTLDALLLVLSSSLAVDLGPATFERMSAKYGTRYQAAVTLIVTIVTALVTMTLIDSATVFGIIVFSASGLGVTIGVALLICLMKWKTSSAALIPSILVALAVTAGWKASGLNAYLMEAAPGFLSGLATHALLVRTLFSDRTDVSPGS